MRARARQQDAGGTGRRWRRSLTAILLMGSSLVPVGVRAQNATWTGGTNDFNNGGNFNNNFNNGFNNGFNKQFNFAGGSGL